MKVRKKSYETTDLLDTIFLYDPPKLIINVEIETIIGRGQVIDMDPGLSIPGEGNEINSITSDFAEKKRQWMEKISSLIDKAFENEVKYMREEELSCL
jgi:hypothetical protein